MATVGSIFTSADPRAGDVAKRSGRRRGTRGVMSWIGARVGRKRLGSSEKRDLDPCRAWLAKGIDDTYSSHQG